MAIAGTTDKLSIYHKTNVIFNATQWPSRAEHNTLSWQFEVFCKKLRVNGQYGVMTNLQLQTFTRNMY